MNKYYIIPAALAKDLRLAAYRHGNETEGYLVSQADLATTSQEKIDREAIAISEREARDFVKSIKKK